MADVELLLKVLHRLVDEGNTVIVIEHNLSVIAEADYIVDIGPEAGDGGGEMVAAERPKKWRKIASAGPRHFCETFEHRLQKPRCHPERIEAGVEGPRGISCRFRNGIPRLRSE